MPQRDLSPKGIRDLAEANETAVAVAATAYMDLTVGAEAADIIPLAIQLRDGAGNAIVGAASVWIELRDDFGDVVGEVSFALSAGAAGTMVSAGGANSKKLFLTDATGALDVNVEDVVKASGSTLQLVATPVNGTTPAKGSSVVFD